jgi:hypothetical protein
VITFVRVVTGVIENTIEPDARDESLGVVEVVIDAILEDEANIDADVILDFVDVVVIVGESEGIEGLAELVVVGEIVGVIVCNTVPRDEIDDVIDNSPDAENESMLDTEASNEFVGKLVVLTTILLV